jgi:hypothetical protein
MKRRLPQFLQAIPEFGTHPRGYMAVDPAHAGYLVAHPLGLENVPDPEVVKPSLVTVA